ncbi:MAG: RES family NAD+ phosphorylase [Planctomycetes bacterium]|nr:RES family NAD+ phosphorylase [Planctomycetota bacterium]
MSTLNWSDYLKFRKELQNKYRYFRTDWANSYLVALKHTCKKRIDKIKKDTELWRSRLEGTLVPCSKDDMTIQEYSCKEMAAPPPNLSRASRIGVTGIPVLYLSSDKNTAMSEVRPWKNQPVSLAKVHPTKDLNIVDCQQTGLDGTISDLDKLYPTAFRMRKETILDSEQEASAWAWIDYAFSKPVSQLDDPLEYIPTQVIAEFFKTEGYDGIMYRSSVAPGYNIALFDINAAKIVETMLYYTNDICYRFSRKQFVK